MKPAPILTFAIALLIAYGTLSPPGPPAPQIYPIDKLMHFGAFALLTLPLAWVRPRHALWLVPVAITYGGAIEVIQPFFGRGAEWADLLADALGALTGTLPGAIRAAHRTRREPLS